MSWIAPSTPGWLAIATLATVLALVLIVAFRYEARRTELFRDAWRSFASSRGFAWIRASGPWYRRRSEAIEGSVRGVPFRLDTYVVSTGKSHTTYTRATGALERPAAAKVTISPRTIFTALGEKIGKTLGRETIRTGDAAFDARMSLRSDAPREALALVDETVRSRLRALDRRASLVVDGKEAKLRWRGAEKDAAVLDAACELVSAVARASARA